MRFIPKTQDWFNISIMHHINIIKDKINRSRKKHLKNSTIFHEKTPEQTKLIRTYIQTDK